MAGKISFTLNGKTVDLDVDGERPLLWVLRTDFGLTGTKYSCGEGYCGACTVLIDEEPVRSCQFPVKNAAGKKIVTIEGFAPADRFHPIQEAFVKHEAMQCGFCTSGMILEAYSLLKKKPQPTYQDIIQGMDDHLCRCGAHNRIVRAIQEAAVQMKGAVKR
jgi:aerobic-type carbon monoxide dehydrogenase small subunit (CoxS/CutS family)